MSKYDHAYTFGFSLQSNDGGGEDVTAEQLRDAIVKALARMDDVDLLENCGAPFDTYEIEDDKGEPTPVSLVDAVYWSENFNRAED